VQLGQGLKSRAEQISKPSSCPESRILFNHEFFLTPPKQPPAVLWLPWDCATLLLGLGGELLGLAAEY
jgi:hypothetical protein